MKEYQLLEAIIRVNLSHRYVTHYMLCGGK